MARTCRVCRISKPRAAFDADERVCIDCDELGLGGRPDEHEATQGFTDEDRRIAAEMLGFEQRRGR